MKKLEDAFGIALFTLAVLAALSVIGEAVLLLTVILTKHR